MNQPLLFWVGLTLYRKFKRVSRWGHISEEEEEEEAEDEHTKL